MKIAKNGEMLILILKPKCIILRVDGSRIVEKLNKAISVDVRS